MSKPMPKGWNKTVADLFEEMRQGKRLIATDEEGEWAREYERSLLPKSTVFPKQGQIWEAVRDCAVDFEVFSLRLEVGRLAQSCSDRARGSGLGR